MGVRPRDAGLTRSADRTARPATARQEVFSSRSSSALLLPALAPAESPAPKPPVAPALAGRGRAVLVVDDEEDVRVFVRKVLEHHGFTVALAVDGRDGVQVFTADGAEFDLVLLDLTMPHLSGADAFRLLRSHRPEVHVVLTSGFAEEEALIDWHIVAAPIFHR